MDSKKFFDAEPRADHKERNNQMEISVDYRLCYEAMAQGKETDRAHLAAKYGRELRTIGQIHALAQDLFGKMDGESRAYDLYDAERKLAEIDQDKDMDHA